MTAGARTPEELDTLLEDAFLQRDRAALEDLFDDGAVLMDVDGVPTNGREAIGRTLAESWDRRVHLRRAHAARAAGPRHRAGRRRCRHPRAAPRRRRGVARLDLAA